MTTSCFGWPVVRSLCTKHWNLSVHLAADTWHPTPYISECCSHRVCAHPLIMRIHKSRSFHFFSTVAFIRSGSIHFEPPSEFVCGSAFPMFIRNHQSNDFSSPLARMVTTSKDLSIITISDRASSACLSGRSTVPFAFVFPFHREHKLRRTASIHHLCITIGATDWLWERYTNLPSNHWFVGLSSTGWETFPLNSTRPSSGASFDGLEKFMCAISFALNKLTAVPSSGNDRI